MEFVKDKTIVKVKHDSGRFYGFDLATFTMYGLNGSPLKHFPEYIIRHGIDKENDLGYLIVIFQELWGDDGYNQSSKLRYMSFCERIALLGLRSRGFRDYLHNEDMYNKVPLTAEYVEFFKGFCNKYVDPAELKKKKLFDLKTKYELTNDQMQTIRSLYNNTEDFEYAEYYATCIKFKYFMLWDYSRSVFEDYFDKRKKMNLKWEKSKNFIETYCATLQEYEIFKNAEINEKLMRTYKPQLAYANDTFTVIVPNTEKQYKEEGDAQSNCVHRLYMGSVANGERFIVFIRRNTDLNKSYVTCEINKRLSVHQYLARNNDRVRDADVIAFIDDYKRYLSNLPK